MRHSRRKAWAGIGVPTSTGKSAAFRGGRERLRHYVENYHPECRERFDSENLYIKVHRTKTRLFGRLLEASGASLRTGVGRLITDARSAGLLLGVCTTSQLETFEILIINALGFEAISWFKAVVSGKDVERLKPDPEGYVRVLQKLRLSPDEAVVIEDSPLGVQAARAAGLRVIAGSEREDQTGRVPRRGNRTDRSRGAGDAVRSPQGRPAGVQFRLRTKHTGLAWGREGRIGEPRSNPKDMRI